MTERREIALVVDDSEMVRFATAETLRDAGFDVLEAGSGEDGLRLAAQSDVVLLDIRLPDVDGFEVCRRLKANPATASIPILHLLAFTATSKTACEGSRRAPTRT